MARPSLDALDTSTTLLDFADHVLKQLISHTPDPQLRTQVRKRLGEYHPQTAHSRTDGSAAEHDQKGTELWNTAKQLGTEDDAFSTTTLPLVQALSVLLLVVASQLASKKTQRKPERAVRILRTSLQAARSCIRIGELDICTEILQRAADRVDYLSHGDRLLSTNPSNPVDRISRDLTAQYWLVRAHLSWKQGRVDLLENHISRLTDGPDVPPSVWEQYADLAYTIAQDSLVAKKTTSAISWFKRAAGALDHVAVEDLSIDASTLRTTVMSDLAAAYLVLGDEGSLTHAKDLLACLEGEVGPTKLSVLQLKFNLVKRKLPPDPAEYLAVLQQLMRTVIITSTTFKLVLGHVNSLQAMDAALARRALDDFIATRLYEHGEQELLEKAVVMRFWTCSTDALDETVITDLNRLLFDVQHSMPLTSGTFSQDASLAALTIVWKCIETCVANVKADVAEGWCNIALHHLLASGSDTNMAKIARKKALVALQANEITAAKEAFDRIPTPCQQAPASLYLRFKIAARELDAAAADECLTALGNAPNVDTAYLFGCIDEARLSGTRAFGLATMQTVIRSPAYAAIEVERRLVLSRCVVQLLLAEASEQDPAHAESLVEHLDHAARLLNEEHTDFSEETIKELQWFAATSWNAAVKDNSGSPRNAVVLLIKSCTAFYERLLETDSAAIRDDARYRLCMCHYLSALSSVTLAREQDNIRISQAHYRDALTHAGNYATSSSAITATNPTPEREQELRDRRAHLLRYELEAHLRLHDWDALATCITAALDATSSSPSSTDDLALLADLIISAHAAMTSPTTTTGSITPGPPPQQHINAIPDALQVLVNRSWQASGGRNMATLARWLRCTFRMTAQSQPDVARRVMQQAGSIASRRHQYQLGSEPGAAAGPRGAYYPPDELEWLVASAFNNAVDAHCAADAVGSRTWAEAALNLAQGVAERPGLYALVQGRWARLQRVEGQL